MKSPITALFVFGTVLLTVSPVHAQLSSRFRRGQAAPAKDSAVTPASNSQTNGPATSKTDTASAEPAAMDKTVLPANGPLPGPVPADQLQPLRMELPNDPIEPYLLSRDAGPYMVLAKTFRGEQSERMALALVKELREDYKLPAFILRTKDFPGKSNIRNVPPTAFPEVDRANLGAPEKVRTYDEAGVMVGNEKTIEDAEKLLKQVKKIKPKCLNEMPKLFAMHENLSKAIRTTNPYVPAQMLFPKKKDKLIVSMNSGRQSIAHCPGKYSLQIADFTGRSTFKTQDDHFKALSFLKSSPLATAHDDAERLADQLSKQPEIQGTGQKIYVYHDRTSSRVFIGSFEAPNDPRAVALRDSVLQNALKMIDDKRPGGKVDKIVVPASYLTDVDAFKQQVR